MNQAIGLDAEQFGFGAGLFFVAYSTCEIPSNMAMYRVGARKWIARIMVTWGIASAATALVEGPYSFYAVRFVLGLAEAGFFPGITFFLAAWFPSQVRARMLAWFLVGIPLSSAIGGPVCGWLLQFNGYAGLAGWKWLFLGVSLPCIPLGIACLVFLADSPQQATFMTQPERDAMDAMLAAEIREKARHSVWDAVKDPRVLILAAVQFGFTLGSYGIGIWLPQIMKAYRYGDLEIGLLSAIPYVIASVAMLAWAWAVDRTGRKISNLVVTCALAAAGLVLSVAPGGFLLAMAGLTLGIVGVTAARAIFWTIPTRFLTGAAAAGGLAFINMVGTTGGFAGPYMMGWLRQETGSFQDRPAGHGRHHGDRHGPGSIAAAGRPPGVTPHSPPLLPRSRAGARGRWCRPPWRIRRQAHPPARRTRARTRRSWPSAGSAGTRSSKDRSRAAGRATAPPARAIHGTASMNRPVVRRRTARVAGLARQRRRNPRPHRVAHRQTVPSMPPTRQPSGLACDHHARMSTHAALASTQAITPSRQVKMVAGTRNHLHLLLTG